MFNLVIWDTALSCFYAYLEGRRQVADLAQTTKRVMVTLRYQVLQMNCGVPQGMILGLVLFVLFTNDLSGIVNFYCNLIMYADDCAFNCK